MNTQNFMEISCTLPRLRQLKLLKFIMDIITMEVTYRENLSCMLKVYLHTHNFISVFFNIDEIKMTKWQCMKPSPQEGKFIFW